MNLRTGGDRSVADPEVVPALSPVDPRGDLREKEFQLDLF